MTTTRNNDNGWGGSSEAGAHRALHMIAIGRPVCSTTPRRGRPQMSWAGKPTSRSGLSISSVSCTHPPLAQALRHTTHLALCILHQTWFHSTDQHTPRLLPDGAACNTAAAPERTRLSPQAAQLCTAILRLAAGSVSLQRPPSCPTQASLCSLRVAKGILQRAGRTHPAPATLPAPFAPCRLRSCKLSPQQYIVCAAVRQCPLYSLCSSKTTSAAAGARLTAAGAAHMGWLKPASSLV